LPPVSTAPVVLVAKFAAGVVDTGGAPCLANNSVIFEKIQNNPYAFFRGLGKVIHEKKLKQKIL
jgi:hypothetical protein